MRRQSDGSIVMVLIDEVHQLSAGSFNALLKSIEEPPPHVMFMMATTELEKIPDTVLSRSQVYQFRAIHAKAIADQLRHIADAEGITVSDESLRLIARDADGSMRDAQSKLDQVIAFTGRTIGNDDVATVLGLVGRDLPLSVVQAVADEDAAAAFALAGRAVEMGYDLRLVCRELSRLVRDLLVLSVDPSRASDPEIAAEGERDRLASLVQRFSREDLLRAFDVLTRAEFEIRGAAQPRYHLEMALLRWIYLRKLVSIEDLLAGTPRPPAAGGRSEPSAARVSPPKVSAPASVAPTSSRPAPSIERPSPSPSPDSGVKDTRNLKDALLAEIRKSKTVFYNTVVAQAQKIEVSGERVTFTFGAAQRALREMFEPQRGWLESIAQQIAGRRIAVAGVLADASGATASSGPAASSAAPSASDEKSSDGKLSGGHAPDRKPADKKSALKEQALNDAGVQALLEVFPAEIRDVEEM